MLPAALKPIAKAVAGVVTPFVIAGVAKLCEKAGIDVPVDPDLVETTVIAIVTGIAVWFTRNRPAV